MKTKTIALLVAGAVLVLVGGATTLVDRTPSAGGDSASADEQLSAAVAAVKAINPHGYSDPRPDVGAAEDIAAVKRDVVADIERDREIMRPNDVSDDLRVQLSDVYAASVLDAITRETAAAIRHAAAHPSSPTYAGENFTVTQWQGVQASPTAAVVTLLGHDSWRSPGSSTFRSDIDLQWRIVLAKEGGRWKLVDESAFDPVEREAR